MASSAHKSPYDAAKVALMQSLFHIYLCEYGDTRRAFVRALEESTDAEPVREDLLPEWYANWHGGHHNSHKSPEMAAVQGGIPVEVE